MNGSKAPNMPLFSAAFREWLSLNPDGETKLVVRGMQPGNLNAIRDGKASEDIILMHRNVLREVANLDLTEFVLLQAKADLWGSRDPLPQLSTYAAVLDALRAKYKEQGGKIADRIGVSRGHISRWFNRTRAISITPMQNVLRLLAGAKTSVKVAPRVVYNRRLAKAPDRDNRVRQIVGSFISSLNSQLNILNYLAIDRATILDGDRAQVIRCANRMLDLFGIDPTTLKRLKEVETITEADTDLLKVVAVFNQKQRRRS